MNQNYNSSTSEQYSLHVSNEHTEMSLPPNALSSANNFEVNLSPALDLNQLSFLQSTDVEVRIMENTSVITPPHTRTRAHTRTRMRTHTHTDARAHAHTRGTHFTHLFFSPYQTRIAGFATDSSPLFLVAYPKEIIRTFLTISPTIVKHNMVLGAKKLEERNKSPLQVKTSDFYTDDITQAIKHVNTLISNGSNLFLIARYAEIVLDHFGVIDFSAFENLSGNTTVDVTPEDLDLLLAYVEMSIFTRIETINYLYRLIDPKLPQKDKVDTQRYRSYKSKVVLPRKEIGVLVRSRFLSTTQERKTLINPSVNPIFLVDFTAFYNVDLTLGTATTKENKGVKNTKADEDKQAAEERNLMLIGKIIRELQSRILNYLASVNKATLIVGKLDTDSAAYARDMIYSNMQLLDMGKKLQYLIHIESERLKTTRESLLFSRPIMAVGLNDSKTKARFHFEHSKLSEYCEVFIHLPRIMSYKLGSSKNLDTQKYNKITIGPISLATERLDTTGITFNITSSKQELSAPIRLCPKLLVVSCDFLSEQSRQAEKELVFFKHDDMVNFFKIPLKQKDLNGQFLAIDTSSTPTPQFYRVHKARTNLNSFKINIRDESGEFLNFARDTIVKINFCFRACHIDRL